MVLTTVYVFWSGFAERVLTIRYASGAVAISAAFGAAWLTVLHMAGVQLAGMSAMNAVSDAVAGVAAADGQRPGALVAQPHSPYVKKQGAIEWLIRRISGSQRAIRVVPELLMDRIARGADELALGHQDHRQLFRRVADPRAAEAADPAE